MLDMNEVLKAREEYKKLHGVYPSQVRMNTALAAELSIALEKTAKDITISTVFRGEHAIGLDWYDDASVSEQERFRLA